MTLEAISFVWWRLQVVRNAFLFLNTLKAAWLFWIDEYFSDHVTSQLSSVYRSGEVNSLYFGLRNTTHTVYRSTSEKQQPIMHALCRERAGMKWGSWDPEVKEDKSRLTSLKAFAMHFLTLVRNEVKQVAMQIYAQLRLMTRCPQNSAPDCVAIWQLWKRIIFRFHIFPSVLIDDTCMVFNPTIVNLMGRLYDQNNAFGGFLYFAIGTYEYVIFESKYILSTLSPFACLATSSGYKEMFGLTDVKTNKDYCQVLELYYCFPCYKSQDSSQPTFLLCKGMILLDKTELT